jgi:hypothetical protein
MHERDSDPWPPYSQTVRHVESINCKRAACLFMRHSLEAVAQYEFNMNAAHSSVSFNGPVLHHLIKQVPQPLFHR